jgi:hypothetical protein
MDIRDFTEPNWCGYVSSRILLADTISLLVMAVSCLSFGVRVRTGQDAFPVPFDSKAGIWSGSLVALLESRTHIFHNNIFHRHPGLCTCGLQFWIRRIERTAALHP